MEQEKNIYDVIIIGGGPAGLSAALYASRALLKTVVFEKNIIGGLITQTTEIENYPGSEENATGYSITEKMHKQAIKSGAEFIFDEIVCIEKKDDNYFYLKTVLEIEYCSKTVIIASGTVPRLLGVEGEKEFRGRGVSYCATCDAGFFKNKIVAVIGGGDTAIKEADYLTKFASDVMVFHRRDELRASVAVKEKIQSNSKIKIYYNSILEKIVGSNKVEAIEIKNVQNSEIQTIPADGVFIFAGYIPETKLFENMIEKNNDGYIITDENMHTKTEGLYAAGDIRDKALKQVITAASDGAIAAVEAEKYIMTL